MFRSTRVQVLVAVFFGLIAAILVWQYTQNMQGEVRAAQIAQATPVILKADVVVATGDVPSRTLLTADMVKVIQVPPDLKVATALSKPEDAIGHVTQYPLASGEQILSGKFTVDRAIETFSYVIPPGKRAFAIQTSEEQGAGGMIAPGDHIDILVSYEVAIAGGFDVHTLMQNVLVLAVSQSFLNETAPVATVISVPSIPAPNAVSVPSAPSANAVSVPISPLQQVHPDAHTMTLALSPEDSQKLYLAELHGTLRFVLRALNDSVTDDIPKSVLIPTIPAGSAPLVSVAAGTPDAGPLSQSTGQSPLQVLDVKISPTSLHPGDVMKVEMTIRNTSDLTLQSQGPDPAYTYVQGQTYDSQNFPSIPGKYRIALNLDGNSTSPFPYRWGFGGDLGPGASTTVVGLVKMINDVKSTTYWAGLIDEPANIVQDSQGATLITVLEAETARISLVSPTPTNQTLAPTATPIPAEAAPRPPAATPTKAKAFLADPILDNGVRTWL